MENNMKTITMATLKGGAGKTMNVYNIGGTLSETGKRVLLFDCDPQANLSQDVGIDITRRNVYTVKDIFENTPKLQPSVDRIIIKHPIPELPTLDIIPSDIYLFGTEQKLFMRADKERVLQKYMSQNKEYLEANYDYILADLNPSMSLVNKNTLLVSDEIIMCSDISANSINGCNLFCELWDATREELGGVEDHISALIISNYSANSNLAKDLVEYINSDPALKDIVLPTIISTTVMLKQTETAHKPINILNPKSKAAQQYRALVEDLKAREIL